MVRPPNTPKIVTTVKTVAEANELRLLCPHCNSPLYVPLAWPYTSVTKQRRVSEAINEHRKLCSAAPPEAERVYRIDYPRA
jgi:hypothetical protein